MCKNLTQVLTALDKGFFVSYILKFRTDKSDATCSEQLQFA